MPQLAPLVMILHAKFDVSGYNLSRDMEGPKISKVGHVTPTPPL